ncbi:unnamed protein product [Caretta caretta]
MWGGAYGSDMGEGVSADEVASSVDEFRTWSRVWVCSFPSPGSDPLGSSQPGEKKRPLGKPGCSEPEAWDCEEGLLPGPSAVEQVEIRFFVHRQTKYLFMGAVTATSSFLLLLLLCPVQPLHQFLEVRFLLGSAPDDARPSPEPPAPHSPPVVAPGGAEAPRAKTGLGGAGGDLAAPQLLTSLALGEEVQAAARQGFDAHRAAQELLATSFLARCSVEGKAAAGMNIPREQQLYQGLVSLQVPAEEVLSSALREKLSLLPSQPEPHREPDPGGPDLLMFYEPLELFAETPYLGVEGLPPLRLQPHVRPPASAFLMFRKVQQWEA